ATVVASVHLLLVALALSGRLWASAAAAAPFGVHPIGVESVTNAVGRAELFATIAALGGLLLHVRAARSQGWWKVPWLAALMLLAMGGVFSKESAVLVGGVIVLYDLCTLTRARALLDSASPVLRDALEVLIRI